MMKRSKIIILAASFGLMMPIGAATAAPPQAAESDARTAAVEFYAESEGVSLEDAGNIIDDQEAILKAANSIDFKFNDVESLRFESDGPSQLAIVRSDDPSHIAAITSLKVSSSTTVSAENNGENKPMSLDVSDATVTKVEEAVPDVQGVYIREADGALMVDAKAASDGIQRRSNTQKISIPGYPTTVVNYADEAADSLSVRGGTGMSSCTAGFPAKYGTRKGFISAAHCPDSTRLYANTSGTGLSTAATTKRYVHNANADIAFYEVSSSNTLTNTRYSKSSTSPVRVGSPADVGTGTVACHRGKTTGYQCGKIASIAYKPTYKDACPRTTCNSVFVKVNARQAGGDSGGPWAAGSRPIGVHKGGTGTFSIYSKLYRTPSGISIQY